MEDISFMLCGVGVVAMCCIGLYIHESYQYRAKCCGRIWLINILGGPIVWVIYGLYFIYVIFDKLMRFVFPEVSEEFPPTNSTNSTNETKE